MSNYIKDVLFWMFGFVFRITFVMVMVGLAFHYFWPEDTWHWYITLAVAIPIDIFLNYKSWPQKRLYTRTRPLQRPQTFVEAVKDAKLNDDDLQFKYNPTTGKYDTKKDKGQEIKDMKSHSLLDLLED